MASSSSASTDDQQLVVASSSSSSFSAGAADDSIEDACSICLEAFSSEDPATVTSCRHEYHLQCILEWAQRSKECPICWQQFVLKDPASQELLAAVGSERPPKSRNTVPVSPAAHFYLPDDLDYERAITYWDSLEREERILQHMTNARYFRRRERQRASGLDRSQRHVFSSPSNDPEMLTTNTSPADFIHGSPESDLPPSHDVQPSSSIPGIAVNRDDPFKPRLIFQQPPSDSIRSPYPSEFHSFSESIKSKWSAASARYKESFSKGTRGLKEKLMARNTSVKELSREVQREMSAGIAGVAKMIERLDLASKRPGAGASVPSSGCAGGTSSVIYKGKGVQEPILNRRIEVVAPALSSDATPYVSDSNPGRLERLHAQREP